MTPVLHAEERIASGMPECDVSVAAYHDFASVQHATGRESAPAIACDRFAELLEIVGPSGREEFLSCLVTDLVMAASGLRQAAKRRDDSAARWWGHALIGIAGTVGAVRLHDLARAFNRDLKERCFDDASSGLPKLRAEVDRLIEFSRHAAAPAKVL